MTPQGIFRRQAALTIAVLAAACALAPTAGAKIADAVTRSEVGHYVPGEAIVRFEPGTTGADRRAARREADVDFNDTLENPRVEVVGVDGSVEAAVRRLKGQPGVAFAQPNYRYEALAVDPPDDTFFDRLWGLSDPALADPGVSALEAWESNKGNGQVIAVVDTGIDLTHPDLVGNLWSNALEVLPGIDDDLNGFVDDVHGYDFVDDDGDPDDFDFHGAHVAGTAAAVDDNDLGTAGVAPEAKIMAVRVLDGDGSGTSAGIADGINYAARNGADVINLSLGGPTGIDRDGLMSNAITFASSRDVVVVAAAGNDGRDNDGSPVLPCALPQANLICVAALNQSGGLASFSNLGATSVDLAAPGTNILSAQTDYRTLFTEGFESGTTAGWDLPIDSGSISWGISDVASTGSFSAADSPGVGQRYAPNSDTQLIKSDSISLVGERGCRMHFDLRREIQPAAANGSFFDEFFAGAVVTGAQDGMSFAGSSDGIFRREEASISDLDNEPAVRPGFALFSDATQEFDGVYIDNLRLLCRDQTYFDALSPSGNYVAFQGTSMAAPHVSGVAALVSAAAPTARATEVVDAILQGASAMPNPGLSRPTATWGIADACQAIAVATRDTSAVCPGSSNPVPPPPPPAPSPAPVSVSPSTVFSAPPAAKKRDRTRPRTRIVKKPAKATSTPRKRKLISFRFRSSERGSAFLCRIDRGRWHQCYRTLTRWFGLGKHVIRVKARDAAGNVDRTPAVYRFRVKRVG